MYKLRYYIDDGDRYHWYSKEFDSNEEVIEWLSELEASQTILPKSVHKYSSIHISDWKHRTVDKILEITYEERNDKIAEIRINLTGDFKPNTIRVNQIISQRKEEAVKEKLEKEKEEFAEFLRLKEKYNKNDN